jgi:hypothetical protein
MSFFFKKRTPTFNSVHHALMYLQKQGWIDVIINKTIKMHRGAYYKAPTPIESVAFQSVKTKYIFFWPEEAEEVEAAAGQNEEFE